MQQHKEARVFRKENKTGQLSLMEQNIQEINGHLIAKSPEGIWFVINTDGEIVSQHDDKEDAIHAAQNLPRGSVRH